ncbi:MAG: hypothetical protein JW891_08650 [Candidatus Lokiarchaeota archaeon]|nr:hypothetical protein [Candidatus Lokiarchaeota archaeon]
MSDSSKNIENFSNCYNIFGLTNNNSNTLLENTNSKFSLLVSDIIEHLSAEELKPELELSNRKEEIIKVVDCFSDYISLGDSLVDSYFQANTVDNYVKFIDILSYFAFIPWKVQKYLNKLPVNGNKLMLQALYDIKQCVIKEIELMKFPRIMEKKELFNFMQVRNSDFFLYFDLLSPFIYENTKQLISEFLEHYVIIDTILDDMSDLYQDYKKNSMNLLLLELKVKNPEGKHLNYMDLIRAVIDLDIYSLMISNIKKHYEAIIRILGHSKSRLSNYLKFLANGCIEGVKIFEYHGYFFDQIADQKKHQNICNFLFKPYPWTIISYEEVFLNEK